MSLYPSFIVSMGYKVQNELFMKNGVWKIIFVA